MDTNTERQQRIHRPEQGKGLRRRPRGARGSREDEPLRNPGTRYRAGAQHVPVGRDLVAGSARTRTRLRCQLRHAPPPRGAVERTVLASQYAYLRDV